jgi:hypothetical protein
MKNFVYWLKGYLTGKTMLTYSDIQIIHETMPNILPAVKGDLGVASNMLWSYINIAYNYKGWKLKPIVDLVEEIVKHNEIYQGTREVQS